MVSAILFFCGLALGGIVGIVAMCIIQINRYQ